MMGTFSILKIFSSQKTTQQIQDIMTRRWSLLDAGRKVESGVFPALSFTTVCAF